MNERIDDLARRLANRGSRRSTLLALGALGLGSLITPGAGHEAEAKNNNNRCKQCKQKCKRNNRKKGKKDPKNCGNKCRNKCRNKNN